MDIFLAFFLYNYPVGFWRWGSINRLNPGVAGLPGQVDVLSGAPSGTLYIDADERALQRTAFFSQAERFSLRVPSGCHVSWASKGRRAQSRQATLLVQGPNNMDGRAAPQMHPCNIIASLGPHDRFMSSHAFLKSLSMALTIRGNGSIQHV